MATRAPLLPYCSMIQPFCIEGLGIKESRDNYFKSMSRIIRYNIELWDLVRQEKLRQAKMPDGTMFSSNLWRRFFNTARVPGEVGDKIVSYFKTGLIIHY